MPAWVPVDALHSEPRTRHQIVKVMRLDQVQLPQHIAELFLAFATWPPPGQALPKEARIHFANIIWKTTTHLNITILICVTLNGRATLNLVTPALTLMPISLWFFLMLSTSPSSHAALVTDPLFLVRCSCLVFPLPSTSRLYNHSLCLICIVSLRISLLHAHNSTHQLVK